MKLHTKKMIAPIIIVVLLVLYYGGFGMFIVFADPELSLLVKLILGIIPLCLAGVSVYVLYERIQEIRSGEEDDLSKY